MYGAFFFGGEGMNVETNVVTLPIKPAKEAGHYLNQKYVVIYDKDAPLDNRWAYHVLFDKIYLYAGQAESKAKAIRKARWQIRKLVRATQVAEEQEVERW
jgi:hypothetical protein